MPNNKHNHEELQKMILKVGTNKRASARLSSQNNDNKLHCFVCNDLKNEICKMLAHKLPSLFSPIMDDTPATNNLNIKHSLVDFYEPYLLTDNPEDQFNSKRNFSEVTMLVISSKLRSQNINADEAFRLLAEIKEQIEFERKEDFLLDGI